MAAYELCADSPRAGSSSALINEQLVCLACETKNVAQCLTEIKMKMVLGWFFTARKSRLLEEN